MRVKFLEEFKSLVLGFQIKTKLPPFVLCETAVAERISLCPIRLPENDASHRVITSGVLRASIMDIPRLDAKGVAVELVNDAIKHAFLTLGYAAATTDQDKAVREFLQGKPRMFSFLYQQAKANPCASPPY